MSQFSGFPPGGYDFFLELQARQSREWFKANKPRYEELWVQPLEALLADLRQRLTSDLPGIEQSHIHIFRIQRDTRFSANKDPYKTHVAAHLPVHPAPEGSFVPSLYIHFGLEENVAALGSWELDKEGLERFRAAIADKTSGAKLQRLTSGLSNAGWELHSHDRLKRVPAPYPQDHPRAELLKLKGLAVSPPDIPEELMPSTQLLEWLTERFREAAPVSRWLEQALLK